VASRVSPCLALRQYAQNVALLIPSERHSREGEPQEHTKREKNNLANLVTSFFSPSRGFGFANGEKKG